MGLERRFSAKQMAGAAIGGSFGIVAVLIGILLPLPFSVSIDGRPSHAAFAFSLSLIGVAILIGVFTWKALEAFKDGVRNEIWDFVSLDKLRTQIEKPLWSVLGWVLVLGVFVLMFYSFAETPSARHHHMNVGGFAYFWLSPFTVLMQIRGALRPRRELDMDAFRLDRMKPLSSEHWGER